MHDVFPRVIQAYIPWLKNLTTIAAANLIELGWTQANVDALNLVITDLEKKEQDVVDTRAAAKSAVEAKDTGLENSMSDLRVKVAIIQANPEIPDTLRENMGIKVHDTTPSHEEPNIPSELIVKGLTEGANILDWKPNGNKGGTSYIITARYGTEGDFVMVDTITATRYQHNDQKAGDKVYYRVAARRGKLTSLFCDAVGIYT